MNPFSLVQPGRWRATRPGRALCVALAALCLAGVAAAFPLRTVTLVVPFTPGGSNDTFARALATELSTAWGQSVIVENRPGGGGSVGAGHVAKAQADGHTLLFMSSAFTINAAIKPDTATDPVTGFRSVALVGKGPMMLVAAPQLGITNARDLLSRASAARPPMNYATAGHGSVTHLAMEMLANMAGVKMNQIPYKGGTQALTDVMGGHAQLYMGSIPQVLPQARAGKVVALGTTGLQASPIAPDIAPLAQVIPGYELELWWGLFAPPGLSDELVARLNADVNKALGSARLRELLSKEGASVSLFTPAQFSGFVRTELQRWREVVKKSNIRAE